MSTLYQLLPFFHSFLRAVGQIRVYIIIVCDGINTNHFNVLYVVEKTFYEVAANKTCSTCYKNCLAFKIYVVFYHKDPLITPV